MSDSMRERFSDVLSEMLDADPRLALVLADIGATRLDEAAARHPARVVNVGIREALMVGVAGGMALEGLRPVVHSYAPFLVERAFEQIKLDLVHQSAGGAVVVSTGASYDAAEEGRTHQAPGDVALLATLPGVTIHVPGHADEVERLLRAAIAAAGTVYIRLSDEVNGEARTPFQLVRTAAPGRPLVIAIGPTLAAVLAAAADHDVAVAYVATVRPFPIDEVAAVGAGDILLVEPYARGTSGSQIPFERPRRLRCLGVADPELHRYGNGSEHRRAHRLDAAGIAAELAAFTGAGA